MGRSTYDNDPLTGGPPIPRATPGNNSQGAATAAVAPAGAPPAGQPPALPAPSSTMSPAALTGGGANPSLDPSRDLRIGAGPGYTAPPPVSGQSTANPPSGAVLRQPQPVNDANFQQAGSLQPPVNNAFQAQPARGPADSYQQLQDALTARGVTFRRLQTVGETSEWEFRCSVPSAQRPNIRLNYEARGSSDLAAIRAVLEQIDRDNQKH
jgi:hypothetical protein